MALPISSKPVSLPVTPAVSNTGAAAAPVKTTAPVAPSTPAFDWNEDSFDPGVKGGPGGQGNAGQIGGGDAV